MLSLSSYVIPKFGPSLPSCSVVGLRPLLNLKWYRYTNPISNILYLLFPIPIIPHTPISNGEHTPISNKNYTSFFEFWKNVKQNVTIIS